MHIRSGAQTTSSPHGFAPVISAAARRRGRMSAAGNDQETDHRPHPDDALKALTKVVAVLSAFTTARRSMSLAEIAAATGFPRRAHRLAASMREVGLLD